MRKIYLTVISFLFVSIVTNAQTDKKDPPPPPPPPKMETVKFTPPKIVKDEETKFTPPKIVKNKKVQPLQKPKVIVDEKVNTSKHEEPPVITVKGELADEFYKRNPSIAEISRKQSLITLKMKDGTTEKYDMSKKEEDKNFTEKYGTSPIPPPPPPPVPKKKVKA